jgi:hypothetical protein
MKIVGVGLNKTGTKTLRTCLLYWGFRHLSYSKDAFDSWRHGRYDDLLALVDAYDSFEDWPWPLIFRQIDEKFPNTKFVLTRRKDAETWFSSLCKHADRTGPTDFRKSIYGFEMPHAHKTEHVQFYENHIESVRNYFRNRPADLLEVCWEEGDQWERLSGFLGFDCPKIPFPHANKSPN